MFAKTPTPGTDARAWSYPIKFLAIDTPSDPAMAASPPTPDATDQADTEAIIDDVSFAVTETSFTLSTSLFSSVAFVELRMTFVAIAPAPLAAPPNLPPNAPDNDAEIAVAMIEPSHNSHKRLFE